MQDNVSMAVQPTVLKKLLVIFSKVYYRFRGDGLLHLIEWSWHQAAWRFREWRLGINTRKNIVDRAVPNHPECVDYEPIDYRCLDNIFHYLAVSHDDVFLDYGSGEGRVVIQAALHGCQKVIGVELSSHLCSTAQENIRRIGPRLQSTKFDIVNMYAEAYSIPQEVTTIFLFNPFTGKTLSAVLTQIDDSLIRHPRDLTLVYILPKGAVNMIDQCEWIQEKHQVSTGFWKHIECFVYRNHSQVIETSQKQKTLCVSST